jgi:hypothetical protein
VTALLATSTTKPRARVSNGAPCWLRWSTAKEFDMTSDDKFIKAILEAPVSVGRHVTQFQFVVADGISRRAPWLTTREVLRDTSAMVRVALEYAVGAAKDTLGRTRCSGD